MPAITVPDILALPRVPAPPPVVRRRPVVSLTRAVPGYEGEGFPVRRAFAGIPVSQRDPFVLLDEMGEVDYPPGEPKGTPWHPHRGFETVTYMIEGSMQHHDSNGGGGLISNGDTQWMTAGGGILHIEHPPEQLVASGGLFHGLQLWVNLPAAQKWAPPRYQDIRGRSVTLLSSSDGGALIRLIAGDLGGHRGPGWTYTPITLAHASISAGATLTLPWRGDFSAFAYVMSGRGRVGANDAPIAGGETALFGAGQAISVSADARQGSSTGAMEVYLLGGRPIREPVVQYGPFVMNTRDEIRQALEDYRGGRLGAIPAVHGLPAASENGPA